MKFLKLGNRLDNNPINIGSSANYLHGSFPCRHYKQRYVPLVLHVLIHNATWDLIPQYEQRRGSQDTSSSICSYRRGLSHILRSSTHFANQYLTSKPSKLPVEFKDQGFGNVAILLPLFTFHGLFRILKTIFHLKVLMILFKKRKSIFGDINHSNHSHKYNNANLNFPPSHRTHHKPAESFLPFYVVQCSDLLHSTSCSLYGFDCIEVQSNSPEIRIFNTNSTCIGNSEILIQSFEYLPNIQNI